jgi:hypothetical protein
MWWRTVVRLAAGLLVLFGVGAGATMALSQSDTSPDCELGILFDAAFAGNLGQGFGIYWVRSDGSNLTHVIHYGDINIAAFSEGYVSVENTLSPDGTQIIVSRSDSSTSYAILDLESGAISALPPVPSEDDLLKLFAWSPDGTKIAAMDNWVYPKRIDLIDLTANSTWPLVDLDDPSTKLKYDIVSGRLYSFDCSPDSQRLAFVYGEINADYLRIGTVNADGTDLRWALPRTPRTQRQLHHRAFYFDLNFDGWYPTWSANNVIYYQCNRWSICASDVTRLHRLRFIDSSSGLSEWDRISDLDAAPDGSIVLRYWTESYTGSVAVFNASTQTFIDLRPIIGERVQPGIPRWACRPPQLSEAGA